MGFAWEVTADVAEHQDAIEWFAKRTVITAAEARKLDDKLKAEAFWIGGGLHLAQVQHVFDEITEAIRKGESLEDFKTRVAGTLRNAAHTETVFRNATQRAYNAGRWAQMREPSTAKFRPVWLYDAILDSRTTEVCRVCDGVLLPWDHVFWDTHTPPLHHRCRSSIRNLRRAEADKRQQRGAPEGGGDPEAGWGQAPTFAAPWKPDLAKVDSQLSFDFEAKAPEGVKTRKRRLKKPKLETEKWAAVYEGRYGVEAAKSLGHGRAAYEVGLDMTVADAREQLDKLDFPGAKALLEALEDADAERTLREQTGELDPLRKTAAAVAGHLRTLSRRRRWRNKKLQSLRGGAEAIEALNALTASQVTLPDLTWTFETLRRGGGGDANARRKRVRWDPWHPAALEHEIGHTIEDLNRELFDRAIKFLQARVRSQEPVVIGRDQLQRDVYAWRDGFLNAYTGRRYLTGDPPQYFGTEITSTALEMLVAGRTHWGTLSELARADFEHLLFLLGQLKGT